MQPVKLRNFMVYNEERFIGSVQASTLSAAERVALNAYGLEWDMIKEGTPMVEEANYIVRVTLTNTIGFSPIERDSPITKQDAISNAISTISEFVWEALDSEGWSVEFTAERQD